jgi:hypothetical protein
MEERYKILVFSDMHGNRRVIDVAKTIIERDNFDMIIYLGDFSEKIGDETCNIEDAELMLSRLNGLGKIKSLFGNCDTPKLQKLLEDEAVSMHNKLIFMGKTAFIGWGGSSPTPFHTPSEFSETTIESSLKKLMDEAAERGAERLILFTHDPPANSNADKLPDGSHVGSEAIRHIIEEYGPNLSVCGHIHEAKSIDHVGSTKVINVGPASNGHYLAIYLDEDIETEEINI